MYFEFVISFVLAFIIAFSATPIARKIAFNIGAVDIPKDDRKIHRKPIARLGGLAMVAGFFVSLFFSITGTKMDLRDLGFDTKLIFLVVGLLIIVITGIIDDSKNIKPIYKLALQLLAASLVVFAGDIRVLSLTNPFSASGYYDFGLYVSYAVSIIWIIGITNAINLIDGLDGLAAGVSAISCISLFFIAIISKDYVTASLTSIIAGSALGFLPYNFNPAKIFMGDTGSMFLGFLLSVLSIQGTLKSFAAISILIPVIALGLPLFDTSFAILRRIVTRKPIMQADRGHLHHRLLDMGLNHRQAVLVLYTASATLGLSAVVFANRGFITSISMVGLVFVFVIFGAKYLKDFAEDETDDLNSQMLIKLAKVDKIILDNELIKSTELENSIVNQTLSK